MTKKTSTGKEFDLSQHLVGKPVVWVSGSTPDKLEEAIARAMADIDDTAEPDFEVNRQGLKDRQFTKANPCGKPRIRAAVVDKIVVDRAHLLERIGDEKIRYISRHGYLVRDPANPDQYIITAQMSVSYNLPVPTDASEGFRFPTYAELTGRKINGGWTVKIGDQVVEDVGGKVAKT